MKTSKKRHQQPTEETIVTADDSMALQLSEKVKQTLLDASRTTPGGLKGLVLEGGFVKTLLKPILEQMLEAEMDDHLGYDKHSARAETNTRNGHAQKVVRGDFGELQIETPRDRESSFEPTVVPKRKQDIGNWTDKIISLYAKGLGVRDIKSHFLDCYEIEVSEQFISNVTNRMKDEVEAWQTRPLEKMYPVVYIDGIHISIKNDTSRQIFKHCVHMAIGVKISGEIDVLGLWVEEHEGAGHWRNAFNELKARGVEDILILCADGLKGVDTALEATFPNTDLQLCVVHQIRNSVKYVPHKDKKEFCKDLKEIYNSPTAEAAEQALGRLKNKWNAKYPASVLSWERNWNNLVTFFKYPVEIRKAIYTTNIIESLNAVLRKYVRNKKTFPSIEAARKMLFLVISRLDSQWGKRKRDWHLCLQQFAIMFPNRIALD
jgi:transposase-like protein